MTTLDAQRPWVPQELERYYEDRAARYRQIAPAAIEAELDQLIADHQRWNDQESFSLNAGTNIMNPRAVRLLGSGLSSRPSLGYPGGKYEMGLGYAEQIEIMATELIKRLFGCRYAEHRVGSGALANLYAYMACTKPGDPILVLPPTAGGHVTHHPAGAAGLYGLDIHYIPFDGARMEVDLAGLEREARHIRPKLIILGASLALMPYPVRQVRAIADEIGAYLLFDAAHLSGIIAGGEFQQPLQEGAHLMTSSTYKSFGGPVNGLVMTNEPALAERIEAIAYPGLTANFDLARTAALTVALGDLLEYGQPYARTCIANARALAAALAEQGAAVFGPTQRGYTLSHHLVLQAAAYGGGTAASRRLEQANLMTAGIGLPLPQIEGDFNGLRMGTQEITRWGMQPDDMPALAALLCRVLVKSEAPETVRPDTIAYRQHFQSLHFII